MHRVKVKRDWTILCEKFFSCGFWSQTRFLLQLSGEDSYKEQMIAFSESWK